MFTNLKNKLIEEVKASPSKFQQFANAAQAAVSSSTSTASGSEATATTNENFFSITEEDTPQNSPLRPFKAGAVRGHAATPQALNNGAIPRPRKLSNSSMASDISFRLPTYDSPAIYHTQSDLDISGSEVEDSASTAKLDVITKEQLYGAYRKSLDRYHKMSGRYTELVKKFKDLERDSSKARSVLVETQEKAIRRISELREQCSLEQQAKAHLEEALRIEMDDMQCKMQAYQTKLKVLGENPDNISSALSANLNLGQDSLIDLGNSSQEVVNGNAANLISLDGEIGQEAILQISQLEKQLQEKEEQIKLLRDEMEMAQSTIESLKRQEEENTLHLAQTKQAIYSELENKEREVQELTDSKKRMQNDLHVAAKKETQLTTQVAELKDLKEKFKILQGSKQEVDAKVMAAEHKLTELREQNVTKEKALNAAEEKISTFTKDSEEKLQDLRQQNIQLNEMIQRYQQNEVTLAEIDNELNLTKNENDNLRTTIKENEFNLQLLNSELSLSKATITKQDEALLECETNRKAEKLKSDSVLEQLESVNLFKEEQQQRINELESEIRLLNVQRDSSESETITALNDELSKLKLELHEQKSSKEKELKTERYKLSKLKKQHENQQNKMKEHIEKIEQLTGELNGSNEKLVTLQKESKELEEKSTVEKNALQLQVTNILQEVSQMEEQLRVVQESKLKLESEKHKLEMKIENMQIQDNSKVWSEQLCEAEEKLKLIEMKLQNVQSENTQLAERNCLLEENSNRLEKLIAEQERKAEFDATNVKEMHLQLESAKNDAIQKLNEKLSQVLDENSHMQNAQELMDHDQRTLQDKCESLEKAKLVLESEQKVIIEKLTLSEGNLFTEREKLEQLDKNLQELQNKLSEEKNKTEILSKELADQKQTNLNIQNDMQILNHQLNDVTALKSDDDKLKNLLQQKDKQLEEAQIQLAEKDRIAQAAACQQQEEITALNNQISSLEKLSIELERTREEMIILKEQNESFKQEIDETSKRHDEKSSAYLELTTKLEAEVEQKKQMENELNVRGEEYKKLQNEKTEMEDILKAQLDTLLPIREELENARIELITSKELESTLKLKISELENLANEARNDIEKLHDSNDAFQNEIDQLRSRHQLQVKELQSSITKLEEKHNQLLLEANKTAENAHKLENYEQIQVENEYLNKHTKQLENDLENQKQETLSKIEDIEELKEKIKSTQCELYVFKEYSDKYEMENLKSESQIEQLKVELENLTKVLENERLELTRQTEHTNYIIEQKTEQENKFMHCQNELSEVRQKLVQATEEFEQLKESTKTGMSEKDEKLEELLAEAERNRHTIEVLNKDVSEITNELQATEKLQEELDTLRMELEKRTTESLMSQSETVRSTLSEADNLREINAILQSELEELKHKSNMQVSNLLQEMEDMRSSSKELSDRILELERIRAAFQAQQLLIPNSISAIVPPEVMDLAQTPLEKEKEELKTKLQEIMHEVHDVSNRNLFLEQKCENYLILEQANERLKLQNSKLSRQLDETLVSMQHNENLSANTEFEYLKNIMFQYLTGSANGNNETLVKVISAVLKFSPQQTQVALEKEHQRRSLINKIL